MKGKQAEIEGFCWNGHKLTVNRFILAIGSYWFGWFDLEAVFFFVSSMTASVADFQAKREEELEALKTAMCTLDKEGVEPMCKK